MIKENCVEMEAWALSNVALVPPAFLVAMFVTDILIAPMGLMKLDAVSYLHFYEIIYFRNLLVLLTKPHNIFFGMEIYVSVVAKLVINITCIVK